MKSFVIIIRCQSSGCYLFRIPLTNLVFLFSRVKFKMKSLWESYRNIFPIKISIFLKVKSTERVSSRWRCTQSVKELYISPIGAINDLKRCNEGRKGTNLWRWITWEKTVRKERITHIPAAYLALNGAVWKTHSMQTRDGNRPLAGRCDDENRREQVVDTCDLGIINDATRSWQIGERWQTSTIFRAPL